MRITRRTFVKGGLAVPVLPVIAQSGCGNDVTPAPIVDTTVDDDSTSATYGIITVLVPMYPQLAAAGGAVTLRIAALPDDSTRPFTVPPKGVLLVNRATDDGTVDFVATRADCPHLGCPLGYSAKDDRIECPCHGSKFLAGTSGTDPSQCAGLVVHLPAKANLTVFGTTVTGDTVYVNLQNDQSCGVSSGFPAVSGGTITLPLAQFPDLANVGGSIIGQPSGLADTIIVARTADQTFITLSDICTHQGCPVALDLANTRMHCPCHMSDYKYDGTVIDGPAPSPLKSYATTFDGTNIVITAS